MTSSRNVVLTSFKLLAAAAFLFSAYSMLNENDGQQSGEEEVPVSHRRLQQQQQLSADSPPRYMRALFDDLHARHKLFDETPPEEIKYWFEYSGPLQKYFYRFSKSRGKADYFEGRDDSGVVSARFIDAPGGTEEFQTFYKTKGVDPSESTAYSRILENCFAMGALQRPDTTSGTWAQWYKEPNPATGKLDRCRVLLAINTVGAGRGTTMLWETNPPLKHAELPQPWTSEQENAVTHLQRNLEEINAMCDTGYIAARVQILVCEPIPAKWTEWMDSMLPACGGQEFSYTSNDEEQSVEDRPSPVQIVVSASAATADTCHDLKSGFMEKRLQDLILAPPYLEGDESMKNVDPSVKTTNPDLFSSDHYDVYVAMKWSSLVTMRAVHSFLQASADIAAGASASKEPVQGPSSPFLIPSFVRVSYVSEENSKVAKWRMHGDFFHPAAWEICKDSFKMAWIPNSLSGAGGVNSICSNSSSTQRRQLAGTKECGQWWIYFTELQMPTSPEVYANEVSPAPVQGGSNFFWMVTDAQRRELVKGLTCRHNVEEKCPALPQAVIPLGDMASFQINFTPNTALGREHVKQRRPGYSNEEAREKDRERVKERKQLNDQEEIEHALFDYTITPSALFMKDATIMAARARDTALTPNKSEDAVGPQTVKSSYYDVTITKPRPPVPGWCQMIARRGLCTLYADYFRLGSDDRCDEACGLERDFTKIEK